MDVFKAIENRRSYRSIEPVEITDDIIYELVKSASLAPSCYNNQPWRFVFVKSEKKLKEIFKALPDGNSWAKDSAFIVAVYTKKEFDCIVGGREYYLFDTGLATAFMMLRATELGLVTHAMAGFDPKIAKKVLQIPDEFELIVLIAVGKKTGSIKKSLEKWQIEQEKERPERKGFSEIAKII